MNATQIEDLRRWGERLTRDQTHPKLGSAGRAILMLIEEIEQLRAEAKLPAEASAATDDHDAPAADSVLPPPPPPSPPRARRERPTPRKRPRRVRFERDGSVEYARNAYVFRIAVAAGVLVTLVFATLAVGARLTAPRLDALGPAKGEGIGPALLPKLKFSVGGSRADLDHVKWRLDGVDVTTQAFSWKGRLVFDGSTLKDGLHVLTASVAGSFPGARTTKTWRFAIDTKGPEVKIDPPGARIVSGAPLRIRGTLEPGAALTANGRPVLVSGDRFTISWKTPPRRVVTLVATDRLRNTTTKRIWVILQPRKPAHPTRAVHMTSAAWADATLRKGVLNLVAQGRINAVVLDLKEDGGKIGWNAPVRLAHTVGAVQTTMKLAAVVKALHANDVRVIGRIVCFDDSVYARWAWSHGRHDQVIQTPDGASFGGGFTNFANPAVRRYQIDIALAVAKLGVDEILYGYVRRPGGPLSTMVFPGLKGSPEQSIAHFLGETRAALKPYGVFLGASVLGRSATHPQDLAQDIPLMAEHLDYVAATVFPSDWALNEYGVRNPNKQPYDIVLRSLQEFQQDVRDTGARVVPWLQDFSAGVDYGPAQVAAEIQGAKDAGIDDFLLWDPAGTYTAAALPSDAQSARFLGRRAGAAVSGALEPDELGVVPVLMHHQFHLHGTAYDLTPSQFLGELTRLWRDGFYPVRASDFVSGRMDVPKGRSPVVLTFDNAYDNQISFRPDGSLDPNTAVGIFEAFSKSHPAFPATGTFYISHNAFEGNGSTPGATMRWLVEHGYELGNHGGENIPFDALGAEGVERQLVLGNQLLSGSMPGYVARTVALPLGALPTQPALAVHGTWNGESYRFAGVFLDGAGPSPSPFSKTFTPGAIPRIRPNPYWNGSRDFSGGMWLDLLERKPSMRYVSDGNPGKITIPRSNLSRLAPEYRALANPY